MFIAFTTKLVRTITLSKIVIWALTAFLSITFLTVYENRSKLLSHFTAPKMSNVVGVVFDVGQQSQEAISSIVTSDDRILGISVMSADIRLNEAQVIHFFADDVTVAQPGEAVRRGSSNRLPLFTGDQQNDSEVIRLINGGFSCRPFEQTLLSKIYPELKKTVKATCQASVPAYYGYFSGFITVFLSEVPAPERQLQLKLIIEKLANDVYFKDVLAGQRVLRVARPHQTP